MSFKFPIGVETIYRPFFIFCIFYLFIFLCSCSPVNYISSNQTKPDEVEKTTNKKIKKEKPETILSENKSEIIIKPITSEIILNSAIQQSVTFIVSQTDDKNIIEQFVNVIELAVYEKKFKKLKFEIKYYENQRELKNFLNKINKKGKIFIGPINSIDTEVIGDYCKDGSVFFSFSSNKNLANECTYLVNFFPENELKVLFEFFPDNSKVAILYPENNYGYKINNIVDSIADQSRSVIVNRASYKADMSNLREAIKELGKYELRKYELNRQKKILATKKDAKSKKRLQRLEKFKTTKDLEFTHVIIADYGIRLLQVAPLLPYYDIDPNLVKFVGTGAWDDPAFFDEPSLQGSIFPGIEEKKRKDLYDSYSKIYEKKLLRISTLPYDIIGLIAYAVNQNLILQDFYNLLNNTNSRFTGIDGGFYFNKSIIERDLDILEISNGNAYKIN